MATNKKSEFEDNTPNCIICKNETTKEGFLICSNCRTLKSIELLNSETKIKFLLNEFNDFKKREKNIDINEDLKKLFLFHYLKKDKNNIKRFLKINWYDVYKKT
jgi:hypothetical protein